MTELAVRDGVASVLVKEYGKTRANAWRREFPTVAAGPVSTHWANDVAKDLPQLAGRGAFSASPSSDGPLAIGYMQ